MTRSRRDRWRAALGIAVVLALAGCTAAGDAPWWQGPSTEAPSSAPVESPPPSEMPSQPRVDVGYRMPRLGPEEAPGLVARLAAMSAPEFTVVARWATPRGESVIGDVLDARFAELVRGFAAEHGAAWTPGVDVAPGGVGDACARQPLTTVGGLSLTVDCSIVVASGTVLGERLIVIRRDDARATSVDRSTWYTDAATGALGDGAALFRPGVEARVLALLAEGLRAADLAGVSDPFASYTPDEVHRLLADTVITADDMVVPVPLLRTAGRSHQAVAVVVPVRLVVPFLNPFGVAVHAAAVDAAPFEAPPAPTGADRVDCTLVTCVSITFDDGPSGLTDGLIDTLRELRAPATFFLQGVNVQRRPDEVRRLVEEEHELGNHTWGHPFLTKLPDREVRDEIDRTQAEIHAASGVVPRSLRPPYGDMDERVRDLAGLPMVVWDVDTNDWQAPGSAVVAERAVSGSSRGSIVLMHDTHEETVAAVPDVVHGLRDRGFTLATVSEQFDGMLPGDGENVSHGPR